MKTSSIGRDAIKLEEGFRAFAYPDPVSPLAKATPHVRWGYKPASEIIASLPESQRGLSPQPWTCFYGQTNGVDENTSGTEADGEADLFKSLPKYEAIVSAACPNTSQPQFDALVCLAWNCPAALKPTSSIVKAHNRGDYQAAAAAFMLYCNSGGKPNAALTARRKREAVIYLTDIAPVEALSPQTVDEPVSLIASKINIAQGVTGATASVAAANEVINSVSAFKDGLSSLGSWLLPLALVAIVGFCTYTVYTRYQLRQQGKI